MSIIAGHRDRHYWGPLVAGETGVADAAGSFGRTWMAFSESVDG